MLFSTIGQWKVFLAMMVAGALVGALYGAMKLLRRALSAGFVLTLLCDLAFGAGAAAILGYMLTISNFGEVRLFALLGAAAGLLLYLMGAYPVARAVCGRISRTMRQLFRKIANLRLIKVIFR